MQMTLQQKSILNDSDLTRRSATTSVSESGLQTPKVSSYVSYSNEPKALMKDEDPEMPEDSFEFPAPPLPLEVANG